MVENDQAWAKRWVPPASGERERATRLVHASQPTENISRQVVDSFPPCRSRQIGDTLIHHHLKTHLKNQTKTINKRLILAILLILLALTIWLLPAFMYNELELRFRLGAYLAESNFELADEGIYVRQQGGASSYYDTLFTVGDEIERLLKSGLEELEIAQEYNKKQRFWLIFLGKEYKDYHQAKTASVERYYQSYQQFLTQKEQEHLNSNTLYLLAQLQDELPVIIATSFYEHVLPDMPERIAKIAYNRQQLLEQALINENINQYYENELEFFLAVYQEIEQKYASGDVYSFDLSIFDKHRNIDATLAADFRQKANEIGERGEEINKDLAISSDSFYELLVDYVKKELNLDQLTKLLAIISNDFPRIKMTETELEEYEKSKDSDDEESEPVKVPSKAIWELVG